MFSGKDEPKAPSLHIKPKDPKAFVTPSPGAYNPVNMYIFVFYKIIQTIQTFHIPHTYYKFAANSKNKVRGRDLCKKNSFYFIIKFEGVGALLESVHYNLVQKMI